MITTLTQDLRYALRQLRRSPTFSLAAIATLAVGIGGTTAIFSVLNAVLLRPPPGIEEFDRIVAIYTSDYSGPAYGASSLPDLVDFGAESPALAGVAGYTIAPLVVSGGGNPAEVVLGQLVTPNFFTVLGARTAVGRPFLPGDAESGGRLDVVVLGHDLWRTRFAGDPEIVGKTVGIAGTTLTVIGVAAEGFRGLLPAVEPAFFVPADAPGLATPGMEERGSRGFLAFGRLAEGAELEQARTQLQTIAARLHAEHPEAWTDLRNEGRTVTVLSAREAIVPPVARGPAYAFGALLMAIVVGVLLIGCANIANLLLARATARRREIGIRLAIGARRRRLIGQMLTESTLLAALGALFGLALATNGTRALARVTSSLPLPFTVRLDVAPDLRVLGFATVVTLAAGLLCGLAPALLATRASLSASLHREDRAATRLGVRAVLAAAQVALAMLLLAGGGLLVRSLVAAQRVDPGFQLAGLLSAGIGIDERSTTAAQRLAIQQEILERVAAFPGVASASYASSLPLSLGDGRRFYRPDGYTPREGEDMEIHTSDVGPDYFLTMGIRLVRGREFAPTDQVGAPGVAIVNEAFVRRFRLGNDPTGIQLFAGGAPLTIVGVVEDGKYLSLGENPRPFVWRAADQWPPTSLTIVARARSDARALAQPVREIIAEVAPDAAVTRIAVGAQHLSFAMLPQRVGAWLLGLFGALGLVLAAIGVYGVMAYNVTQRTREFGIRMALGATRNALVGLVVRQGMVVCGIGAVIGLLLAAGATRLMRFVLFGVSPLDPATFVGVSTVVLGAAFLASWLPARRSARADPLELLRLD